MEPGVVDEQSPVLSLFDLAIYVILLGVVTAAVSVVASV
jgi:hypothetical protein